LDYWRNGTAPVLLIVVEPDHDRAYWKSIQAYFDTPERRASKKVIFNKNTDALTKGSGPALAAMAEGQAHGTIPLAGRRQETLTLNFLKVARTAPSLYWAPTEYGTNKIFGGALRALDPNAAAEWIVRSGALLSFHDLDREPWRNLVDVGAMEVFDVSEWADSEDPDRQRQFVELLNRCLSEMVRPEFRRDRETGVYYFGSTKGKTRTAVAEVADMYPAC